MAQVPMVTIYMTNNLTSAQEKFCQLIVDGSNQTDAYLQTYPKSNDWQIKSVHEAASKLVAKLSPRIDELRHNLEEQHLWRRVQSVRALIDVVETAERCTDVIAAIRELNRMHGYDAPIKTESQLTISFFDDDVNI